MQARAGRAEKIEKQKNEGKSAADTAAATAAVRVHLGEFVIRVH
jgi:hypothetical protein